jgi:hypothetical protein
MQEEVAGADIMDTQVQAVVDWVEVVPRSMEVPETPVLPTLVGVALVRMYQHPQEQGGQEGQVLS